MYDLAVVIVAAFAVLGICVAHWFPWPRVLSGSDLPRLVAYAIGVGIIFAAPTIWIKLTNSPLTADQACNLYLLSASAAGITTILAWVIDWEIEHEHKRNDPEITALARHDDAD